MSSGEKERSDAQRARQELAAIVETSCMTQREAAETVGATISLLQRWRLGDPIALEVMQALARKGTQVTHTGGEKPSHTARRNLQRKAQKQLARWMRAVPSIVESMEEEGQAWPTYILVSGLMSMVSLGVCTAYQILQLDKKLKSR